MIDKQTGAYKGTKNQLQKLIDKKKKYYVMKASEKDFIKLAEQQIKNQTALKNAQKKLNDVVANMENTQSKHDENLKELDELGTDYSTMTKEQLEKVSELKDENDKLTAKRINLTYVQKKQEGLETATNSEQRYFCKSICGFRGI